MVVYLLHLGLLDSVVANECSTNKFEAWNPVQILLTITRWVQMVQSYTNFQHSRNYRLTKDRSNLKRLLCDTILSYIMAGLSSQLASES